MLCPACSTTTDTQQVKIQHSSLLLRAMFAQVIQCVGLVVPCQAHGQPWCCTDSEPADTTYEHVADVPY